jgi:hypothetical protein
MIKTERHTHNSTYPKGEVSCSKDSFVINQTLIFQIKFCGKSPALRVAADRNVAIIPNDLPIKLTIFNRVVADWIYHYNECITNRQKPTA